jgi:LysR family positive regulator for ilvC
MNIKSLQIFLHLSESKSFNRTASAMHISPSALSRQIKRLEQDAQQVLFIRDNRSVELTTAGRELLSVAHNIVNQWQGFVSTFSDQESVLKGEIRLFCSVTASYSHLPQLLSEFRLLHPFIEYKLSTGDPAQAIEKVLNDEADIAISAESDSLPSRIVFENIGEVTLSLIAPKGVASIEKMLHDPVDWNQIPFIVPESGTARERSNTWFKKNKIKPNIYAQVSGHEAIVSMVALGCGVGIAPDVVINNSPVKDRIQRLDVAAVNSFKLGVCCRRSQLNNPLIKALWSVAEGNYIAN